MLASGAGRRRLFPLALLPAERSTLVFFLSLGAPCCGNRARALFAAHSFASPDQPRASSPPSPGRLPLSRGAVAELNFAH
ncbi:MC017.1L [Molluscum contagiosum virus]|uniref:MC017.1L n=1 Tax=Molluscum contagiosum virus TaxID=10279 RepID=A0A858A6G0_9POXV|nr:MC017.1L [Molluscum contagiosum virus]QHW17995.1 MC017.1L [Molluscum contagiosum virus]